MATFLLTSHFLQFQTNNKINQLGIPNSSEFVSLMISEAQRF